MSPRFLGQASLEYTADDGNCRGMKWCQRCKDRALAQLLVKSGIWWELHQRRGATCPMCHSKDCRAAADHNQPCQNTPLGPPIPPHMFGGLRPRGGQ